MSLQEKFIFCWNWISLYEDLRLGKYNKILERTFPFSLDYYRFVQSTHTHPNAESAWFKFSQENKPNQIQEFVEKLYNTLSVLPLEN